jgi:hypothetical protein
MSTARNLRGGLTINTVVSACLEDFELVIEEVQSIIDDPQLDIPDEAASAENVRKLQHLQSYYSNQYPYLVGLWGALRHAADRSTPGLIAARDYLEKAASACKQKYEAASRLLTGYQTMMEEYGERRW